MRKLQIVVASMGGAFPAIVAASLAPACGARSEPGSETAGDANALPVADGSGGDRGDGATPIDSGNDNGGDAADAAPLCQGATMTYLVPLPPPGVPADPGQICAVAVGPVVTNTAARVTLVGFSQQSQTATGYVAIAPGLQVLAPPTLSVSSASAPGFASLQVTGMTPTNPSGFTFQASWPAPLSLSGGGGRLIVQATFPIQCDDGGTQTVQSTTELDMCIDGQAYEWASSGDSCTVCQVIAEMAPSPIVSDKKADHLPLARVIQLEVRLLARVGASVVLFAENDGGSDVEYEWRASGGRLERIAPDVVLWTLPSGAKDGLFVQAVVCGEAGAAVATYTPGLVS